MVVPVQESENPVILVIGHSDVSTAELVKLLVRQDGLDLAAGRPGPKTVPWQLDNKYYTADVEVVVAGSTEELGDDLWERVDGVVAFYDARKTETHRFLEEWLSPIQEKSPEVLLCVGVHEKGSADPADYQPPEEVLDWCLDNQFEHIELREWIHASPDAGIGSLLEDKVGIDRIVEALNANMWSNMVMKDNRTTALLEGNPPVVGNHGRSNGEMAGQAQTSSGNPANSQPDPLSGYLTPAELDMLNNGLFKSREPGEDDDDDDLGFERAFEMMATLKERSQHFPDEQRRLVAERVALAFLAAMGGDPDDLLSDGDDF